MAIVTKSFLTEFPKLKNTAHLYDKDSLFIKEQTLKKLSSLKIPIHKNLIEYQNILLFLAAHAHHKKFSSDVQKEIKRLTLTLKKTSKNKKDIFNNSGLPFTETISSFTHDLISRMQKSKSVKLHYHSSDEDILELNHILSFTLPGIEKEYTSAGYDQHELWEFLGIKETEIVSFLIEKLHTLDHVPYIKDFLLDKFNLYITIEPQTKKFSKAYNQIPILKYFYHHEIIKKFDHLQLLNSPLPSSKILNIPQKKELVVAMQTALALLGRETDPCTFIEIDSIRFYELERGISIAIFGMIPERQLPVETYVGYTLFKNGYPCAYGGAWLYGKRALFGINIFEQFRGGESGYLFIQLLRTYKQVFQLNYFEVEPYQYGADNPEGIKSGAFWFYYRYGFRPLDKKLNQLAKIESEKIKLKKGYRSSEKILTRFTDSNIGWLIEGNLPPAFSDVREKVTRMIQKKFKGSRKNAISVSLLNLKNMVNLTDNLTNHEKDALIDFALIIEAYNIKSNEKLNLIEELIRIKWKDLYRYNEKLEKFLSENFC